MTVFLEAHFATLHGIAQAAAGEVLFRDVCRVERQLAGCLHILLKHRRALPPEPGRAPQLRGEA